MQSAELSFVVILGVMAAFYFIFIRPARQEQKRLEETIRDLQAGDEVITTAGFFARIKEIRTPEQGDVELILDLGGGIEIRALTTSILRRIASDEATTERTEEKAQGP